MAPVREDNVGQRSPELGRFDKLRGQVRRERSRLRARARTAEGPSQETTVRGQGSPRLQGGPHTPELARAMPGASRFFVLPLPGGRIPTHSPRPDLEHTPHSPGVADLSVKGQKIRRRGPCELRHSSSTLPETTRETVMAPFQEDSLADTEM